MAGEVIWVVIIGLFLLGLFRGGWRFRLPRIRLPLPPLDRRQPRWWKDAGP